MALPLIVDSLEEVDAAFRGEYVKDGEKFRLDLDGYEDPAELRKTLQKERKGHKEKTKLLEQRQARITELEEKLAAREADDDDDDPPEGDPDKKKAARKADITGLKKKLRDEWEKEHEPVKTENDILKKELRRIKLTDKLRSYAREAGVFDDDLEDALKLTEDEFDLDENDEIIVLDQKGEPSADTPEQFWGETFKKRKPRFYRGAGGAGGGAGNGRTRGSGDANKDSKLDELPPEARLTRLRETGFKQDKARRN